MYPVAFDGWDKKLCPPREWNKEEYGECKDLFVSVNNGVCKSCWKLSFKEFVKFLFGRKIYLYIVSGNTQPPVKMMVE